MKKFILAGLLALCFSQEARADNFYTPYIGIDGIYNKAKALNMKPQYFGVNFNLGTTYNSYFGTELFYEKVWPDSKKISQTEKHKTSYRAYGLDLVGYLPFGCEKRFNLLGTLGLAEYVFHEKIKPQKHHNNSAYGYRFGVGGLYHFNEKISLRGMVRYVHFDHIANFDRQISYLLGLRYSF